MLFSIRPIDFRRRNTDENTPLQFFDEIEIHPLIIDVEDDVCPDMFPTIYQCLEKLGPPIDYGEKRNTFDFAKFIVHHFVRGSNPSSLRQEV